MQSHQDARIMILVGAERRQEKATVDLHRYLRLSRFRCALALPRVVVSCAGPLEAV